MITNLPKKLFKYAALLCLLIYAGNIYSQLLNIHVSENQFGIDHDKSLIVSHLKNKNNYADLSGFSELEIKFNNTQYKFKAKPSQLNFQRAYLIENKSNGKEFTLYFTELPLIDIVKSDSILDEPKTIANFTYSDSIKVVNSLVGIELRGVSSLSYPKKTYDLEFWNDASGKENKDLQFGNLRTDDDWVLDALYNEPLRIRSFMAHKLWLQMHLPHYLSKEPKAKSGADLMYVELFLNGDYKGLYCLSEQIDRKLLDLKKHKNQIRGELYKGASWGNTLFIELPIYNNNSRVWGGFEVRQPGEENAIDWNNIYQFINFVMHAPEQTFANELWSRFDQSNYIDYFMFINAIRALDNTGKNTYIAKYNRFERYFYVPWDLDGCFGTNWEGKRLDVTHDIIGNEFMKRVSKINPRGVLSYMGDKWKNYRNGIFNISTLEEKIKSLYRYFFINRIYERESLAYPDQSFNLSDLSYMNNWLKKRLTHLDTYFDDLANQSDSNQYLDKGILFPNPCVDKLKLSSNITLLNKPYKIYNTQGAEVQSGINSGYYILVNHLPNGQYLLKIENEEYRFTKEINIK